jgi:hypothetical protein
LLLENIYVVETKQKKWKGNGRGKAGHKEKGSGPLKEAHFEEYLKNQKVYKLDVKNENVQNTVNEHETNKSEREGGRTFFLPRNLLEFC